MKYLLLALLIFFVFWYYKKRKMQARGRAKSLEVEMIPCPRCGLYFPPKEGRSLKGDPQSPIFCSESCLKEYLQNREGRKC